MSWRSDPRKKLRVSENFDLATFDRAGCPGFVGKKKKAEALIAQRGILLAELQERLFAEGRSGGRRSVLCVVQGLDTAGKGGVARHVMGMVDPQGVQLRSFGVPTEEEASHHFLWRIQKALPSPGHIGVFDRSHYEDVLVQRVENIVSEQVWRGRYDEINQFEKELVDSGTVVLKFALMVSYDEQARRLMERLDRPDKRWKFSPGDLHTRSRWDDYQAAYADVFRLTNTAYAPWYVIPADQKWYSHLAITEILTRTMVEMDLMWPVADFDVQEQRAALATTMSDDLLQESLEGTEATLSDALEAGLKLREELSEFCSKEQQKALSKPTKKTWKADLKTTLKQKKQLLNDRAS